jgi:hypothetical protein
MLKLPLLVDIQQKVLAELVTVICPCHTFIILENAFN